MTLLIAIAGFAMGVRDAGSASGAGFFRQQA
jgi:hypothetical protein